MKKSKTSKNPKTRQPWLKRESRIALGLFFVTVFVYLPSLGNDFINYYDDNQYVVMNGFVNQGFTLAGLAWLPTSVVVANWHPLTNLTHMLDAQLYGLIPWGHHLTSILLHGLASLLLFVLLLRLTSAVWRSAIVAALFALHPMHVESVAWVAERKDVLSACLWFMTTLAYVNYVRTPGRWRYGLVLLLFVLALMSKVMVVTLPFTLLLLDYWPLRRVSGELSAGETFKRFLVLFVEKIPLFALSLAGTVLTFVLQSADATLKPLDLFPLSLRLENAITSLAKYLLKLLWPSGLSFYYPLVEPPAWQWIAAVLLILTLTGLVLWQARRRPYLPVGWFWYLGTLVPVIQIVQTGSHAMADRYSYIPSVGVFLMAVWLIHELVRDHPSRQRAATLATALLLLIFSTLTYFQQYYWKDSETLFRRALAVTKDNPVANYLLGAVCMGQGRLKEAENYINEGLRIFPDGRLGYFALGSVKYIGRQYADAVAQFRKAAETGVEDGTAHFWAGKALDRMGRPREADNEFNKALPQYAAMREKDPESAAAAVNMAVVLERLGRASEALATYEEALRLEPTLCTALDGVERLRGAANANQTTKPVG